MVRTLTVVLSTLASRVQRKIDLVVTSAATTAVVTVAATVVVHSANVAGNFTAL